MNEEVRLAKGDVLFRDGDKADKLYIIKSGKLACFNQNGNSKVVFFVALENEIVGEEGVLSEKNKHTYNVICLENSVLSIVNADLIESVIQSKAPWIRKILGNISQKTMNTKSVIVEHVIRDCPVDQGRPLSDNDLATLNSFTE